jgi:hypothetical protein
VLSLRRLAATERTPRFRRGLVEAELLLYCDAANCIRHEVLNNHQESRDRTELHVLVTGTINGQCKPVHPSTSCVFVCVSVCLSQTRILMSEGMYYNFTRSEPNALHITSARSKFSNSGVLSTNQDNLVLVRCKIEEAA